jgi:hypothetical protein
MADRMMPAKRQMSQAGKNDPSMLNVGERLQPAHVVASSAAGKVNHR